MGEEQEEHEAFLDAQAEGEYHANLSAVAEMEAEDSNKMEKIDRQFLENIFGTEPEVEDLQNARGLIDEWLVEVKENGKSSN